MSAITDLWQQLVRRRLWPVAVLLLGALVAIPVVLAKEPAPLDGPAPTVAAAPPTAPGDPVVALATVEERDERRRVVGDPKDPFAPTPRRAPRRARSATATPGPAAAQAPGESAPAGGGGSAGGGSVPTPGGFTTPPVPAPVEETTPEKAPAPVRELYSLTVRFGDSTAEELEERELPRSSPLPDAEDPVVIYLGPSADGKRAVFLLDQGVHAQGDGECDPTPTTCETIELAPGETEFLDVPGPDGQVTAQYQLEVVTIHRLRTRDAKAAQAMRARESAAGRKLLSARIAVDGPLRFAYDAETGTLDKLSRREYRAAVAQARSARAARRGGPPTRPLRRR